MKNSLYRRSRLEIKIIMNLSSGLDYAIRQSVTAGTALLILALGCYSAPYYKDGFGLRASYNCTVNWCGEHWVKDRIIRYNYTAVSRVVYKTISVTKQNLDCSHANSSLDCENQDMEASTIQVPEMTLLWNRTTPAEVQVISHELSLGLIKTDNIDVWGKVTSSAYPTNRDKIWQLSVPQPGCSMLIYFHEFDIERSQNCKQDYFSVQIRKRQSNIPRYCNTLSRIELGRTRRVQLWIHSGNSTSRRGLYAMYCFSHWPLGPADLPCSCNGRTHHKAQRSINTTASSAAEMTSVDNSRLISEYLLDMIRFGEDKVAAYLREGNRLQQHLASKFLEAISWLA